MLKGTPHLVLLTANFYYSSPIASQFFTYLEGTDKREFTRDEWNCVVRNRQADFMYEFRDSLHDYRLEDAWPVMFDDFVRAREQRDRI